MADDATQDDEREDADEGRNAGGGVTYTPEEERSFGRWVELGALEPEDQWILEGSHSRTWRRRDPSGSEWVMRLLRTPLPVLMREPKLDGITEHSHLVTTLLHHHRGLEKRVIVTTVTVEESTSEVSMVIDKETAESS
jgi:hypothetical protein